jgi:hypothetical protein
MVAAVVVVVESVVVVDRDWWLPLSLLSEMFKLLLIVVDVLSCDVTTVIQQ